MTCPVAQPATALRMHFIAQLGFLVTLDAAAATAAARRCWFLHGARGARLAAVTAGAAEAAVSRDAC